MADNSVDSIVTDPPYGLSFMGKKWDYDVPSVAIWAECLRVLKPGGYLLSFGGSRTYHRMAVAVEDAGFEIRDQIMWVYGSGFPKSHNGDWGGTALKPSHEPIVMARKPLIGTVEANWLAWGVGALNIDGCRVEPTGESRERTGEDSQERRYTEVGSTNFAATPGVRGGDPTGRWPANLIHDGSGEVLAAFPDAKGQQGDVRGNEVSRTGGVGTNCYGEFGRVPSAKRTETDKSAARFFYCAKASKRDRDEGLTHMPTVTADPYGQHRGRRMEGNDARIDGKPPARGKNHHPTVKPTDLMAYLCRLVTPPGGVVFDPFMGSGSTGKAAVREGLRFIGCDMQAEYVTIARARITHEAAKTGGAA